ncbi:hypothetical protein MM2B1231_3368 [Mycobacteroides abscessus subsp. bolletii 2B-1231]|nr:hypothetical protein MM2B0626_3304 [Mycobacteroides abscessus subsp. bolletii 2B-0626]EIV17811.1 hypothetical protein MM2B0912S_3310 [Mycobacteroides abscessus subsp. bolletii 2B-0912-S]EIV72245.1 hypothetical protein MM2B1231_3368 [Mycobacteroides abscessus subsp. bolletii 2B-1231]ESV56245.1 hypothetical protein L830_2069 [Mycobacteroides abscessus MAB_082312_2258]ETZ78152.1 hypothetical protein L831_3320 [Mycobacteroides abscessus MAB_082312_2272]SLD88217.1 Uncharacterised protein [Mycoba
MHLSIDVHNDVPGFGSAVNTVPTFPFSRRNNCRPHHMRGLRQSFYYAVLVDRFAAEVDPVDH